MKKLSFLSFLLMLWLPALSCDICGCFMGITPYDNQSSFGLMHRYRIFSGHQGQRHPFFPAKSSFLIPRPFNQDGLPHTHAPGVGQHAHADASDYEAFRVLELRAKYFIHQRIEINAFVPLVMNSSRFEGNTTHVSGLGDVTLFAGFHALRKIETLKVQQRLILGGGAKIPTGEYDRTNAHTGNRYPMLIQRGTGSTDWFVYANYIVGFKRAGLNLNASYKLNGQNHYQEGMANSTATFANLFYRIPFGKAEDGHMLVPSVQLFYEFTKGETFQKELTGEHRMDNALLGPGLDLFYRNFVLNLAFQFPVYEAATDHPLSAGRTVMGISYNLKQKKYLLPPKQ